MVQVTTILTLTAIGIIVIAVLEGDIQSLALLLRDIRHYIDDEELVDILPLDIIHPPQVLLFYGLSDALDALPPSACHHEMLNVLLSVDHPGAKMDYLWIVIDSMA